MSVEKSFEQVEPEAVSEKVAPHDENLPGMPPVRGWRSGLIKTWGVIFLLVSLVVSSVYLGIAIYDW